jgi:hypothetical protein
MLIPTFEQWVDWVFTGPEPEFEQLWDDTRDRVADWQLEYATTLFSAPSFLLESYTEQALRNGFWSLPNAWDLRDLIWDQGLDWDRREACLRAMYFLFRDLFARNPLEDTCFMWWDLLRYFGQGPDLRVIETQLSVLGQILSLSDKECQRAALHGLGHITHDGKADLIAEFLSRPGVNEELRTYAGHALAGDVL